MVYAEGPEKDRGIAVRTMSGTYLQTGTSCGRKTYEKEGKQDPKVIIYYWDDRDGPEFRGWWFGNTLAGAQVWSRCDHDSDKPPFRGWKIPWDGQVQEDLRVESEASRQERDAKTQLEELKQQSTPLILAAKKSQEKVRLACKKRQMDNVSELLQELASVCDALRMMSNKLSAIPKPSRSLSNNEVLEELQELGNLISKEVSALKAEDLNVRQVSKEVEDERVRKEQDLLDDAAMTHFLPDIVATVNVAEDEVEKALITFSMLRSCEEEATALEGLKLTENALSTAQKALDDTKAKLKAKRGTLPSLKNSRPRGEVELERLEQQLQSAQVKLKPLRTARQDWDHQRRSRKLVEEVEQQIILAEVEMDRVEVILKSQDTESVTAACVAEVQAAVKLSADAQQTMMMHFSSRKFQNSGSKHVEALTARVDSVQARHIAAESNLQNMEDRLTTDGFLAEVKANLEAIKEDVRKMQELLQKDQDDLSTVKAAEELNVKIQQSFPVTKVFLSMKIVEVKRLTTEAGVAALVCLQECEEQLEMSREAFEKQSNLIGEKRAKAHLEQAAAEVLVAEQKAAELKEASRVWAETDLVAEELKEATEKSLRLEREVNKALGEARKVIACRQIEAKNKNTPHSFVVGLEQLQNRLVQVQSEVGNQRKLYAIVEQRMKGRKIQQEIEQKLKPLEEGLQAAEKMAEKHELLLSQESANLKELMKELKNAEIKTQDLQLSLKPLARLMESAKVDGSRLQEMQERFQSTLTKLKQNSEACFLQDLLRDAEARFATAKASADEVERGAPSKTTDAVQAATALNKWEKSIQTVMLSISSNRSEMSLKRLGIQRLKSDGAVQAVEALNGTISEMEGLNKRLTEVRSKAAEDRRRLFQRPGKPASSTQAPTGAEDAEG